MGLSNKFKGMVQGVCVAASRNLLVSPPPGGLEEPREIPLQHWLGLPIDERAPARSVAILEVHGNGFSAVVVDTVADQLRWRVTGERERLALLYEGMLGAGGERQHGTTVMSAPLTLMSVRGAEPASDDTAEDVSTTQACSNCGATLTPIGSECLVCGATLTPIGSQPGGSGVKGTDPGLLMLLFAKLISRVLNARSFHTLDSTLNHFIRVDFVNFKKRIKSLF